jgi:hypothetical protein
VFGDGHLLIVLMRRLGPRSAPSTADMSASGAKRHSHTAARLCRDAKGFAPSHREVGTQTFTTRVDYTQRYADTTQCYVDDGLLHIPKQGQYEFRYAPSTVLIFCPT